MPYANPGVIDLKTRSQMKQLRDLVNATKAERDKAIENMVLAANAVGRAAVLLRECRAVLEELPATEAYASLYTRITDLLGD